MPPLAAVTRRQDGASEAAQSAGRGLAPVKQESGDVPAARLPAAPFLAHLIATARRLPQTRERRRASPGEAAAAYADATGGRIGKRWPARVA
jgi:hypothetical protein